MGYRTYTCPISRSCGGCEWLAVPYPIQLRRKQEQVVSLLGGAAERDGAVVDEIRGMDEPLRSRHKAATPFAHGGRGRPPRRKIRLHACRDFGKRERVSEERVPETRRVFHNDDLPGRSTRLLPASCETEERISILGLVRVCVN